MALLGGKQLLWSHEQLRRRQRETAIGCGELANGAAAQRCGPGHQPLIGATDGGVGASGDAVGAIPETLLGAIETLAGPLDRRSVCPLGPAEVVAGGLHEELGARRRSLERAVGDLVSDAAIDLVPEAGEHRQSRSGDGHGDRFSVEHSQLVACSPTADDNDGVERPAGQQLDAASDHRHGAIALNTDVAHGEPEADATALEFVLEVVPGRAADTRDHADA